MCARLLPILCVLVYLSATVSPSSAEIFYSGTEVDLLKSGTIVHDADNRLTFDEVVATYITLGDADLWSGIGDRIRQYGKTYWLITKITNTSPSDAASFYWQGRAVQKVDLWQVSADGVRTFSGGRLRPLPKDYIAGADEFFEIDLPFGEEHYLVARFETFSFDEFHVQLTKPETFRGQQKWLGILSIMLLGVIFGLGAYHGFLAGAISDRTYAYYAGYTLGAFGVWSGQFGMIWYWSGDGLLAQQINLFSTFLSSGFGVLFSMAFMNLKAISPNWYRIGKWITIAWFVFLPLSIAPISASIPYQIFEVLLLLSLAHIFGTCWLGLKHGSRNARYYLLSASFFLAALAYWLLISKGIVPEIDRWQHVIFAAASLQMITLAAALAARINWLERDVEYAKEADRAKSQFLATMSHEIRTPMNSVLGFVGLLLDSKLSASQREYAETIKNSGESLLSILNDVLDLTKIESGALELEVTEFSLAEVIDSVVDLMGAHAYGKGIELAAYTDPRIPVSLKGDPGRLRQVLLNLVNNAIKFTHLGGITIEITPEQMTDAQCRLKFSVTDTGIGVSKDKVDELFNRFTQADASITRKYGGTGLGLSICKQIVELMGGSIDVRSQTGQGSEFWFVLDFQPVRSEDRATLEQSRQICGNANILVVDDSEVNRSIFKLQLEAVEADVTLANSAKEAIALIKSVAKTERPFDVIIIDHMMPEEDGSSLALSIRNMAADRIPKLILSSSSGLMTMESAAEFGFDALLPKPVRQEALYKQIAQLVSDHAIAPDRDASDEEIRLRADSNVRILLAEDNSANQLLFVAMLTRAGHSVDVAGNGLEAVEAIRNRPYDIVLMDVHMPEMGGLEATQRIRNMSGDVSKIPIIALTANAMKGDRERFIQGGMNDYVAKPVDAALLFEKIDWWTGATSEAATIDGNDVEPESVDESDTDDLDDLLRDLEAS